MRILMTADPVGGVFSYALELCGALAQEGDRVLLATMGAPLSTAQRRAAEAVPELALEESTFRLEWMEAPWEDLDRAGDWLLALARRFRAQLVHLNHLVHADLPWGVPVLSVGHSCVLSWWEAVRGGTAPGCWDTYRARVTRSLRSANCVVAPSRSMLSALERHYGPLGIRAVVPNARAARPYLNARAARPAKEPLILGAGRVWDEAKNLRALAQVAAGLPWPTYVAGPLQSPAGAGTALDAVHCLGTLSPTALADWYARAAIYALPARYEPFGLTVLEAALCGCALVLGDIPSLRELWGAAAVFVDPDDSLALHAALSGLCEDEPRRLRLGELAAARAAGFSMRRFAGGYRSLYSRCLSDRLRPCVSRSSITR